MYNRYIPQSDGTYKRSRIPEQHPSHPPTPPAPPPPPPCLPPEPSAPPGKPPRPAPAKPPHHTSVDGFLRKLLPKNFDTGDLMIVLLLLLMAGDCEEDRNTALLTLALYFFF